MTETKTTTQNNFDKDYIKPRITLSLLTDYLPDTKLLSLATGTLYIILNTMTAFFWSIKTTGTTRISGDLILKLNFYFSGLITIIILLLALLPFIFGFISMFSTERNLEKPWIHNLGTGQSIHTPPRINYYRYIKVLPVTLFACLASIFWQHKHANAFIVAATILLILVWVIYIIIFLSKKQKHFKTKKNDRFIFSSLSSNRSDTPATFITIFYHPLFFSFLTALLLSALLYFTHLNWTTQFSVFLIISTWSICIYFDLQRDIKLSHKVYELTRNPEPLFFIWLGGIFGFIILLLLASDSNISNTTGLLGFTALFLLLWMNFGMVIIGIEIAITKKERLSDLFLFLLLFVIVIFFAILFLDIPERVIRMLKKSVV